MPQINDPIPPDHLRIHYHRADADYDGWVLYAFGDTADNLGRYDSGLNMARGGDAFGVYFDVGLAQNARDVGLVVHKPLLRGADQKDPPDDMHVAVAEVREAWVATGQNLVYTTAPTPAQILDRGFSRRQAYLIDRKTVAVRAEHWDGTWRYALVCSPDGTLEVTDGWTLKGETIRITLTPIPTGLRAEQLAKYPQLGEYAVFHLPDDLHVAQLKQILKGQLVLAANNASGTLAYLTGLQTAGALDDLFYYPGQLGLAFASSGDGEHASGSDVRLSLWAPTAQAVTLLLYQEATDAAPESVVAMQEYDGVWSATGDSSWTGKYYLYDLRVYVPAERRIIENTVTDPYSVDLALNGEKSRITDLHDANTKPEGWDTSTSPELRAKGDLSIYELHVRDFSANDGTVDERYRGTYLAFASPGTAGMRHLAKLAEAGLKAVHLLPTFHFSSVDENKSAWKSPGDLTGYPADSDQQQQLIQQVANEDAYNWGYDPMHYLAPEGSYAFEPTERVKEYRQMVLGLHQAGLRVVQDLVFNHTNASGQAPTSVLDKIAPGYYHRLDADGNVENGSCCSDTASEHRMMEKLMIDTIVQNARAYKIDGFRFDLMGFHFVSNMQQIAQALQQLTVERDGVDGSKIYLYGEGWETGTPAHNALGVNASQANLYGYGIGTFNDRIRDGIRGGDPFSDHRIQGFATGLFTDASENTAQSQSRDEQRSTLLKETDWIKVGLTGNLRDFTFLDSSGQTVRGADVDYRGQAAGYTKSPSECINFCSVHDNQTLFDAIQLKSPLANSGRERARRQVLAMSLVALGQGVPFFLAGDDMLRSKDMDQNSFNSGDWFNQLDFSYQSNHWGMGLPAAKENGKDWWMMQPLLANPALKATAEDIGYARDAFRELLAVRKSSPLFGLATLEEVQQHLHFLNGGAEQIAGLIVMLLEANGGDYGTFERIVVTFNASKETIRFADERLQHGKLRLHPVQAASNDETLKSAKYELEGSSISIPALTTAVFVEDAGEDFG